MLTPRLFSVKLVLSLSHFKSSLKPLQNALLSLVCRFFFPFETSVHYLLPVGLVPCKPTHSQQTEQDRGLQPLTL